MSDNKSNKGEELSSKKTVSRREFVKNSGMVTGGLIGGAVLGGFFGSTFNQKEPAVTTPTSEKHPVIDYSETRMFFKRKEDFDVLSIASERLFPADEHGPGAIELGVPYFIDKQLAGPWGMNVDDYMRGPFTEPAPSQLQQVPLRRGDIFISGLRKMNEVSKSNFGNAFNGLEEEQQIEILKQFESGEIQMNQVSSAFFFALLRQTTIEGAYCDPMYGGNKNMAGWKMKEFPGAQVSYLNMVEKEFAVIEPISLGGHH